VYRLARLIKRVRRQMVSAVRARLEPVGTSLQAVQILTHVAAAEDLNQLELARQIEQEPAALCRLIVDLESHGLVVRCRDPADNRRVLVTATPAGSTLLSNAKPRVLAGIEATISRLTRQEQNQLCALLEKLAPDDEAQEGGSSERERKGGRGRQGGFDQEVATRAQ
jgi:MarR family transcriptional regulator, lower aerobic nicotinate degradation pathway regulator